MLPYLFIINSKSCCEFLPLDKEKIKSYFIGKYNSFKADRKIDTMYNLLGDLTKAKSTLCFNWLDPTATTSRYHEAIALGIFPFVWKIPFSVFHDFGTCLVR